MDRSSNRVVAAALALTLTAGVVYSGPAQGSTAVAPMPRSALGADLGFSAHLHDPTSGLILARALVLDPLTGSFLQRDPNGYQDSVNQYAYGANDPINHRDPTGKETPDEFRNRVFGNPAAPGQLAMHAERGIGKVAAVGVAGGVAGWLIGLLPVTAGHFAGLGLAFVGKSTADPESAALMLAAPLAASGYAALSEGRAVEIIEGAAAPRAVPTQIGLQQQGGSVGAMLNTSDPEVVAARAAKSIPEVPTGKTVAANPEAQRTLSGWSDREGYLPSSELTEEVLGHAQSIGYQFKPHRLFDQGVPGRYYASHAEPQMSCRSLEFGVSRPMCSSCRSFMSARARADGKTYTIADPENVWTFAPEGTSSCPR